MKSTEELIKKADEIIDSLEDFNIAEKYRIISSLYRSLKATIKSEGMKIIEIDLKKVKQ